MPPALSIVSSWLRATRPKTLPAAVAPVTAGTILGGRLSGSLRLDFAVLALGACLALQVATNLFNDALDHQKGADTARRVGPRRATASGDLSAGQVHAAAFAFLFVSGLLALPLLIAHGWPILLIGLPSLYLCYGYTGGPLPLAYRGLGDLFVLLFFGWVAVTGSCFLQTGHWNAEALLLGSQVGLLSTALIAINNLRDLEEDRRTGKRTLAVRYGPCWARWGIAVCLLAPAGLGLLWLALGAPMAAYWPWLAFPLGLFILRRIWITEPSAAYNRYLALAALHLLLVTAGLVAGLLDSP